MTTAQQLWQQLQQQGLVIGDMPAASEVNTPWYVRVMLGVAGWIGALFLLGFVGVGFFEVIKSASASIVVGLMACAAAYLIFRWLENSDFGAQFGLAVSMAGQGLVMFGLFNAFGWGAVMSGFMIFAFQGLLALLIPNAIHRALTSWSAMLALTFALFELHIHGFASGIVAVGFAIIWTDETCWAKRGTLWRPIGYGLALALLQIETLNFFGFELWNMWSEGELGWWMRHAPMIGTVLVTMTFLWLVKRLLDGETIPLNNHVGMIAITAALVLGGLSFVAQGMTTALLILLLGFATGNRVLMGLGLLALGGFMSHYYYQLQQSLLFKSLVLMVSGAVLLSVRLGLQKYFPLTDKENADA
jgi:hypothetical protein